MKKNILLILLSAFLLTGCEFDVTLQKLFSGKQVEEETQQKEEQNNQNSQENQGNSGENQQQSGENQGNEQGNENHQQNENLEDEYVASINTSGQDFRVISTEAGVQIDDTNYSANVTKLKEYFDSKLEYKNLITNLSCTKLNTAVWQDVCYLCIGTGYYINDRFAEGDLTWTSAKKIYKVEIEAMAYAKAYQSGFGVDQISHVLIDEDDHSLETTEEPVIQSFSKEYSEGVTSFSIKSTGSRVLLKSLKITWRG